MCALPIILELHKTLEVSQMLSMDASSYISHPSLTGLTSQSLL